MSDITLTSPISNALAQPTLALMKTAMGLGNAGDVAASVDVLALLNAATDAAFRAELGLGTAALLSPGADVTTALGAANKAALNTAVTGGQALIPASVASAGAISGTTIAATGVVTVPAGTAGAPAIISTTGTADTGPFYLLDTYGIATAGVERMRLDSSGNFGLGTTSPGAKLHANIAGTASTVSDVLTLSNDLTGGDSVGSGVKLKFSTNSGQGLAAISMLTTPSVGTNDTQIRFQTQVSAVGGLQDRMTITDAGSVGIGMTGPLVKLDVDGPVRCKSYTVATVPSAATAAGQLIYVTDAAGGAVHCSSNGSVWKLTGTQTTLS